MKADAVGAALTAQHELGLFLIAVGCVLGLISAVGFLIVLKGWDR